MSSFFRMYIPHVYRRATFRRRNVSANKSNYLTTVENLWNFNKICTDPCGRESSFHNVWLLGHNQISKSVKVPIFPLALNATVAAYMTAWTTFKVLSFFGWILTEWTNTIYTAHIAVTIITINGVQKFTKNCLFV